MDTLFALIIGIAIGLFLARGFKSPQIEKVLVEKTSEKDKRKEKIIEYLKEHGSITNDQTEELLGLGNTAAYNYLEELEQADVVEQIGKTGKYVKYHLR